MDAPDDTQNESEPIQEPRIKWTKVRSFDRFMNDPSSLRYATTSIITLTAALVILGAVLIRVFDPDNYPTIGSALWFTLQTVTTVGYGDNPPTTAIGRWVAAVVMLVSLGLITVVTAIITSLFIQAARRGRVNANQEAAAASLARIEASLTRAHERLDRIEQGSAPAPHASGDDAAETT